MSLMQAETTVEEARSTACRVRRVTWAGLAINLGLSAFKLVAGLAGHSQAILADAVHSLSDSSTDIAILVGSAFWSRPPDEEHPYGHRRIETVISIAVGLALAVAGIGIAAHGLVTIRQPHETTPGRVAFVAALVSILVKEALYRWTRSEGRRLHSLSLQANAWHHRSDALSSVPAALAVAGAIFLPSWQVLDHIGAVVVAVFIFQAAYSISRQGVRELVDQGAPAALRNEIMSIARSTEGVREVHALRTRYIGSRIQLDLQWIPA